MNVVNKKKTRGIRFLYPKYKKFLLLSFGIRYEYSSRLFYKSF